MRKTFGGLSRLFRPLHRRGRKFARDDRGVTMIEFGLLAIPFFAIIGATLETALVFMASQILDSAVYDASRTVRTGQAQSASMTETQFRTAICNGLYGMFDCSQLRIRVSVITDFASATVANPVDTTNCTPTCQWQLVQAYNPGVGSDIVMVQAYYKWPVILNFAGFNLMDQPDGTRLLGAVRVFRNEPF